LSDRSFLKACIHRLSSSQEWLEIAFNKLVESTRHVENVAFGDESLLEQDESEHTVSRSPRWMDVSNTSGWDVHSLSSYDLYHFKSNESEQAIFQKLDSVGGDVAIIAYRRIWGRRGNSDSGLYRVIVWKHSGIVKISPCDESKGWTCAKRKKVLDLLRGNDRFALDPRDETSIVGEAVSDPDRWPNVYVVELQRTARNAPAKLSELSKTSAIILSGGTDKQVNGIPTSCPSWVWLCSSNGTFDGDSQDQESMVRTWCVVGTKSLDEQTDVALLKLLTS
jgi:hypothetical protein